MFKVLGSDQQVYGPVTAAQLRQWIAEGRVLPSSLIQPEGATEWKPLSSFPEFAIPPVISLPRPPAQAGSNNMALWALLCGLGANVCCCASMPIGVLGLIFSIIVLTRVQDQPGDHQKQLALIGLILSIIGLLWHSLLSLFFFMPGGRGLHFYRTWRM